MERLMKTSKTVDAILNLSYRLLIVVGAIVFVCVGVCLAVEAIGVDGWTITEVASISIGNMELEFQEAVQADSTFIIAELMIAMVTVVIAVTVTCYMIRILRKVLAPMIEGTPFCGTVSGHMKKLGLVVMIGGIIMDITAAVVSNIALAMYDLTQFFLPDVISHITVQNDINLEHVLVGVLVIMLSHVFRYGEELQQQADETL